MVLPFLPLALGLGSALGIGGSTLAGAGNLLEGAKFLGSLAESNPVTNIPLQFGKTLGNVVKGTESGVSSVANVSNYVSRSLGEVKSMTEGLRDRTIFGDITSPLTTGISSITKNLTTPLTSGGGFNLPPSPVSENISSAFDNLKNNIPNINIFGSGSSGNGTESSATPQILSILPTSTGEATTTAVGGLGTSGILVIGLVAAVGLAMMK